MAKTFSPKVISANDLLEGDVVWMMRDGGWTRDLAEAAVALEPDEAQRLLASAEAQADKVVGPFLADVSIEPGRAPQPTHFREVYRTRGPSNRPDLGRQAERS